MFENLVECAKNRQNNRRWRYFATTLMAWSITLVGTILGGIYFYDVQLEEQLRVISLINPAPIREQIHQQSLAGSLMGQMPNNAETTNYKLEPLIEQTKSTETIIPKGSGQLVLLEKNIPSPDCGGYEVEMGAIDGFSISTGIHCEAAKPVVEIVEKSVLPPPPPPAIENPGNPTFTHCGEGVIRGNSLIQVKPEYPTLARTAKASGDVKVEITISETGDVINAFVINGHPLLHQAAVTAVRHWKFKPTLINSTPVKVQGVITFKFIL